MTASLRRRRSSVLSAPAVDGPASTLDVETWARWAKTDPRVATVLDAYLSERRARAAASAEIRRWRDSAHDAAEILIKHLYPSRNEERSA